MGYGLAKRRRNARHAAALRMAIEKLHRILVRLVANVPLIEMDAMDHVVSRKGLL